MTDFDNQNVFEDEVATSEGAETPEAEATTEQVEEIQHDPEKITEETGETETVATPTTQKTPEKSKTDKMIPEYRMKAAIKDVTEKLNQANKRIAELTAAPAPDRSKDPDGYDRHIRIETSKAIMMETHDDYDAKIEHFQEMVKVNPALNQIVGNHAMPAKLAYDLAKRDLELRELSDARNSDEWKEFQDFRKSRAASAEETAIQLEPKKPVAPKVPNLNRSGTAISAKKVAATDDSDELFADHHSRKY